MTTDDNTDPELTVPDDDFPERIDAHDPEAVAAWADRLDASVEQLHEALDAVGDRAADVEMHLKGTHSTTNADRISEAEHDASAGDGGSTNPPGAT